MTVAAQVKQTVASLKGIRATLDNMALTERVPATKSLLQVNSEQLTAVISNMEKRIGELELQEPQYRGF